MAGIAACSGQSCSCITPIKGGFPPAQKRENGVQARMTQSFFQFVSANAATIIPALLPGGTTFNVPPVCSGSAQVCCAMPPPMCQIAVTPSALSVTPAPPNKVHFSAQLIVKTLQNFPVHTSLGDCNVSIDTTRSGPPALTASGDVVLPIDMSTDFTGLDLANATVDNIDTGDVNLDENGSDFVCGLANVGFVKDILIGQVKDQVGGLVSGVKNQVCEQCMDVSDCSAGATACASGRCIGPDGVACIQRLGIEGRANVGSFFKGISPAAASIDLLEAAGGYVTADTGLSMGILGGAIADPHNPCVPLVTPPPSVQVAPSVSFQGDTIPGGAVPYHVGIGVHLSHLTALGYSLWDSGGLCLQLGSAQFMQLSAKTLSFVMPSLGDLYRGDDAAMVIKFLPQQPPTFKLGAGTFKMVNGMNVVDDPLITMTLPSLHADFYLFIDDRYVRVATLTADLVLPIGLTTDMTGTLLPVAGDLSNAFKNLTVSNTELLAESPDQLAGAFPTLFSAAFGGVFNSIGGLALPTFAGLTIHPKSITSTDPDSNGAAQYLAIYSDVTAAMAVRNPVHTSARLVSVDTPPTSVFAVTARDGRVPSVTVEVENLTNTAAGTVPLEWSYSFDQGAWHPFQTAGTLAITDPVLWLQGRHSVSLRSRVVDKPETLDPSTVDFSFMVDPDAPTGDFTVEGDRVVPHASDRISAVETLRYRVDGGALVPAAELRVPAGRHDADVRVEAVDEAGNLALLSFHKTNVPTASGCSAGGNGAGGTGIVLLLFAVVALGRRRAWLVALVCAPLALSAGCNHGASGADKLSPSDAIGRTHDVVVSDRTMKIAAYDVTFGDLAYGEADVDNLDQPFDWILVDGNDPNAPKDATTEFRHGQSAPGPDVGYYQSIAVTNSGDPRIAYFDNTSYALKYASGGFPFETHFVESGTPDGETQVGLYPSISLDAYDTPAIAYMVTGLGDGETGFFSELHLAVAHNDSPHTTSDWAITTVDATPISCAGRCVTGTACILTDMVNMKPNTNPAISTCQTIDLAPCNPGCGSDQACIKSMCKDVVVQTGPSTLPEGTGLYSKLLRNPTNSRKSITYYDHSLGQVRVATEGDGGMLAPNIVDGMTAGQDVGQFATSAFGTDGTLHVGYGDAIAGTLLYKSVSMSGVPSAVQVVDDGMRDDGLHPVGASASVLVSGGGPSILYQDQATADLLIASGNGQWSHTAVRAGADGSGFSSHLVTDGAKRYYSSWIIDRAMQPLGRLALGDVQ